MNKGKLKEKIIRTRVALPGAFALCLGLLTFLLFLSPAKADGETIPYVVVSLGDSYASGEGVEPFYDQDLPPEERVKSSNWVAHRSANSWAGQLRVPYLEGTLSDYRAGMIRNNPVTGYHDNADKGYWYFEAVSGAKTAEITGNGVNWDDTALVKKYNIYDDSVSPIVMGALPHLRLSGSTELAPQIDVFNRIEYGSVRYVTVSIGGNDAGFSKVLSKVMLGTSTYLHLNSAESYINEFYKNDNQRIRIIMESLADTYRKIHEAAGPQATILVAGYPTLLNEEGYTPPGARLPIVEKREAFCVNEAVVIFNYYISQAVKDLREKENIDIHFVNVMDSFKGHEAYTEEPYINPLYLGTKNQDINTLSPYSDYSFHPNEKGIEEYRKCFQEKIDALEKDKAYTPEALASSPFVFRQDYYLIWDGDVDNQTFSVLSRNGLALFDLMPEWDYIWSGNSGILDGNGTNSIVKSSTQEMETSVPPSYRLYRIEEGRHLSLFSDTNWCVDMSYVPSPDGHSIAALCMDPETKGKYLCWFLEGEYIILGEHIASTRDLSLVFSPDGQSVLYSYKEEDAGPWRMKLYTMDRTPDSTGWGTEWDLGENKLAVAVANAGQYIYWMDGSTDESAPVIYVQQGNNSSSAQPLGDSAGYAWNHVLVGGWQEAELSDDGVRFGRLMPNGPFLNRAKDQIVYCQKSDGSTWYSERGGIGKLLFSEPATPIVPYNITYSLNQTAHLSGLPFRGGMEYNFGLDRLNNMVYQVGKNTMDGESCDLYWVDENWNTVLLDRDVESRSLSVSADGLRLHFAKNGALYVSNLAGPSKKPYKLAENLFTEDDSSYFWASHDGKTVIWADASGNLRTLDAQGKEVDLGCAWDIEDDMTKFILRMQICPVGEKGILFVRDNKQVRYLEKGTIQLVLEPVGISGIICMDNVHGVYVVLGEKIYGSGESSNELYQSTDGIHFTKLK